MVNPWKLIINAELIIPNPKNYGKLTKISAKLPSLRKVV
jgi:hypothetical protein